MSWIRMDVESVVAGGWEIHCAALDAESARQKLASLASAGGLGGYTAMVSGEVSAVAVAIERHSVAYMEQTLDIVVRATRLLEQQSASAVAGGVGWGAPATSYAALYPATMTIGGHTQPPFFIGGVPNGQTALGQTMTIGGHTQPDFFIGGARNGEGLLPRTMTIGGGSYTHGSWGSTLVALAGRGPQGAALANSLSQSQADMASRILLPAGASTTRGPSMMEVANISGTKWYR